MSFMHFTILKSKIIATKSHRENAGNRICGKLDFKFFGEHAPYAIPQFCLALFSRKDGEYLKLFVRK